MRRREGAARVRWRERRGQLVRIGLWTMVLAVGLVIGFYGVGPIPSLAPLLHPLDGAWGLVSAAEMAPRERVALPGLVEPVTVAFDDRGVPHVFAESSEDAARALGYVVARDRLFQLELRWRTTAGRLSELVGEAALDYDRRMRRLGLAWSAERGFASLEDSSPVVREIAAYAEGVNARIADLDPGELPLEYRLLGARPARWEPAYSVYLLKLMGWDLTHFVTNDLVHLRLRARFGGEAARALAPIHSPIQQPIVPNGEPEARFDLSPIPAPGPPDARAARLAERLELALGAVGWDGRRPPPALGSNNWVVAPARTMAGHALLAGDPHLTLTLPSLWYEAHLVVPGELDVYGATIPSVPFVVIGFNRHVAWSFTNTGADVIDYYLEELDQRDRPTRYRLDGDWKRLGRRVEEYRDRHGTVLAVDTLYFTHRGPIIWRGPQPLSMRWTVLEGASEPEAFWGAARATSVRGWLAAMTQLSAPAQNGAVADRSGAIAIRSTGRFPLHPDGVGLELRDGTSSASDWLGFWPPEQYPLALNPPRGYLASANQEPVDPEAEDRYMSANWPAPWRAIRINELLTADSAVTPEAMRRYQVDPGSARADFFVPRLLAAAAAGGGGGSAPVREAARLLREWDRRYTPENDRAILFEYAMDALEDRAWDELLDGRDGEHRIFTPSSAVLARLFAHPGSPWWDDTRTAEVVETRDDIIRLSLADALERALRQHGEPDEGGWRWERVRHINIYHLLDLPALSSLGLPIQGGPGTLNPASGRGVHGASWRMVVELGDDDLRAWTIYPGGQSGHPVSDRYADRIRPWVHGQLEPVRFPPSASQLDERHILSTLILEPPDSR